MIFSLIHRHNVATNETSFERTRMTNVRRILIAAVTTYLALSNASLAQWFNDFDDQVALSADREVAFSCPPPDVDFIGPTFEVYFSTVVPLLDEPLIVFTFDEDKVVEWSADYGAELYVGPLENPYGSADVTGNTARLAFGSHRAATDNWVALAEDFMAYNSVIIAVNGVSLEPISLSGSSRALRHIAYFQPPC